MLKYVPLLFALLLPFNLAYKFTFDSHTTYYTGKDAELCCRVHVEDANGCSGWSDCFGDPISDWPNTQLCVPPPDELNPSTNLIADSKAVESDTCDGATIFANFTRLDSGSGAVMVFQSADVALGCTAPDWTDGSYCPQ